MRQDFLDFSKRLFIVAFPIALQQLFLNLASLIDTLMIGQLDDVTISGVYIATQILFVVNLLIFGATEGGSVYFCQFFGVNDVEKEKNATWYKLIMSLLFSGISLIALLLFSPFFISLFTDDPSVSLVAQNYLNIVQYSVFFYAITSAMGSSLREAHKTNGIMIATLIGNLINILLNYVFIFGNFSMPELREIGAAIGTFADRAFEFIALFFIVKKSNLDFTKNLISGIHIEKQLFLNITKRSIPLLINETLWVLGQTAYTFFFSKTEAIAITVLPIISTIFNLLYVIIIGFSIGVNILIGNTLGTNDLKKAQKEAYYSITFNIICAIIIGITLIIMSSFIVNLYTGVSYEARETASLLLKFQGVYTFITTISVTIFYLLRAGGRTFIVFMFDSMYAWIVSIPFLLIMTTFFPINFVPLYMITYSIEIIKNIFGFILLFSKKWCKNIINE